MDVPAEAVSCLVAPPGWEYLCPTSDFDKVQSKAFQLKTGATCVVWKHPSGTYYAIDNFCAHSRGQLVLGDIEDIGDEKAPCARCPKHRKKFCGGLYFNMETGQALTKSYTPKLDPTWKISTFQLEIKDNKIFVLQEPKNGVPFLQPKRKLAPFALVDITHISHDTSIYSFLFDPKSESLENPKLEKAAKNTLKALHKPPSEKLWHLDIFTKNPESCHLDSREYTPLTLAEEFGQRQELKFVIKRYSTGFFSQSLQHANIGDTYFIGPPKESTPFKEWFEPRQNRPGIGFIAAGSGIAPVYQLVLRMIDRIKKGLHVNKLTVIYSNKTLADILLLKELEQIENSYPQAFKFIHTLTQEPSPPLANFLHGRVSKDMMAKVIPHAQNFHVLVCGPAKMWEDCLVMLKGEGYTECECSELQA